MGQGAEDLDMQWARAADAMPRVDLTLPPTPREAQLIRERDAAIARAETLKGEAIEWRDANTKNGKAHEKEVAVWSENYAALERQLAEARSEAVQREQTNERTLDDVASLLARLAEARADVEGE